MNATKFFNSPAVPYAFAALAAAGAVYIVVKALTQPLKDAAGAVGTGVVAIKEGIGGIATGKNIITNGTAYEGKGIFGTLGGAFDAVTGGLFSTIGSELGSEVYDLTHSDSLSIQGSRGDPVANAGSSDVYSDAANASPTNAQYRATPFIGTEGNYY